MKKAFLPSIALLYCMVSAGQSAFTNTGSLQIHTGASVTGFGNFSNTSSATLVNNGGLYVKGNISNDQASLSAGTGTLYLNGSVAQVVNGSQAFNTYGLVTSNASGITLNNNLVVNGAHVFTNGIIVTSSTPNYLVYEAGSSHSGNGDNAHVNGWVKKIGSTDFIFPVGNGTVARTILLHDLSLTGEFNAMYFANTPYVDQLQPPVWDVDKPEYWTINKVSGGSASVTLNWDNSKVNFPNWIVPDILVTGYNGSVWTDNGGAGTASGSPATTGTVTSNSISSFNLITFGSRSYVLPLILLSFTADRQDGYSRIMWTTERELNLSHFIVERSDNGSDFFAIGQMPARNRNTTEYYNFRDYSPINKIVYYRLRMKDTDGKERLSRIVSLLESNNNGQLQLLTNPVQTGVVLMAGSGITGSFDYRISSTSGQLVQYGKLAVQNGVICRIELRKYVSPGSYMLDISNGKEKFTYKIVIQ